MARGGQGLARVAVVVRAGAAPLWWLGVVAAGVGVLPSGLTGRRIGVLAGAVLFIVAAGAVAWAGRGRYLAPARGAVRAGKHDVLQDRAVTLRNWRRGHRWWLLLGFAAALGSSFALPAAGGMLLMRPRYRAPPQGGLARPPRTRHGAALLGPRRLAVRAGRLTDGQQGGRIPGHRHRRGRRGARGRSAEVGPPLGGPTPAARRPRPGTVRRAGPGMVRRGGPGTVRRGGRHSPRVRRTSLFTAHNPMPMARSTPARM